MTRHVIQVNVGDSLRAATNHNPVITTDGSSVAEVISRIDKRYSGFARQMISSSAQLRSNIAVTRASDGCALELDSILTDGETLQISLRDAPGG